MQLSFIIKHEMSDDILLLESYKNDIFVDLNYIISVSI